MSTEVAQETVPVKVTAPVELSAEVGIEEVTGMEASPDVLSETVSQSISGGITSKGDRGNGVVRRSRSEGSVNDSEGDRDSGVVRGTVGQETVPGKETTVVVLSAEVGQEETSVKETSVSGVFR